MDEIAVKVDLKDEILIDAEGLDSIVIYVNNYVKELETLTNSLTQHKESTDNPHAVNTTQEFADAKITALQPEITGGEIPDTDYNAFKAFFSGLVDKSVKSFIRGLVSWVNSLAVRVGLLEDSSYLDTFKISVGHLNQHDYFNAAKTTGTGITSGTITANRLLMYPISVSDNITIDLIACRVAVSYAGGEMRLAIYEGNPFYPYTLLWQSEGISQGTLGVIQISLNLTLYKNKCYWLCVIANNSNAKLYSFQVYQVAPLKGNDAISTSNHSILFADYPYGVLPSKLEGLLMYEQYNYIPNISLRKA